MDQFLNIYNNKDSPGEYESCFKYGFELDNFQKEACYFIYHIISLASFFL